MKTALLPNAAALGRRVVFSIRPRAIRLYRAPPAADGTWCVPGTVTKRAYLGDAWDYQVTPGTGGTSIRVSLAPNELFRVNERVWIEIDLRQVAPIAETP